VARFLWLTVYILYTLPPSVTNIHQMKTIMQVSNCTTNAHCVHNVTTGTINYYEGRSINKLQNRQRGAISRSAVACIVASIILCIGHSDVCCQMGQMFERTWTIC